jgi:hypothetical protein
MDRIQHICTSIRTGYYEESCRQRDHDPVPDFRNRPQCLSILRWSKRYRQNKIPIKHFCIYGALTMMTLNVIDPARMTVEERRAEIASILAIGLIRLRTRPELVAEEREKLELGFSPPQSVHTNPASRVRSAVREALLAKQKGV